MAMLSLYGCTVCRRGVIYGCHVTEMTKKKFVTCPPSFGIMFARIHVSCHVVSVCWLYGLHTGRGEIANSHLVQGEL